MGHAMRFCEEVSILSDGLLGKVGQGVLNP